MRGLDTKKMGRQKFGNVPFPRILPIKDKGWIDRDFVPFLMTRYSFYHVPDVLLICVPRSMV